MRVVYRKEHITAHTHSKPKLHIRLRAVAHQAKRQQNVLSGVLTQMYKAKMMSAQPKPASSFKSTKLPNIAIMQKHVTKSSTIRSA